MAKQTKVYQQSKDLYVSATIIYSYDSKAYVDEDHTEQFTASALKEVFLKGALIKLGENNYATPIGYVVDDNDIGFVYFILPDEVTPTTAVIADLASVADPE